MIDTGYRRSPVDHRDWILGSTVPLKPRRVPKTYMVDRRNPLVAYDQGAVPSCVGWSLATLKTVQERKDQRRTLTFDGLELYKPVALPGGGAYIRAGLENLRHVGAQRNGRHYKVDGYAGVNPRDHDAVRHAISSGRGVVIGFEVTRTWAGTGGREFDPHATQEIIGGHAMFVGGYTVDGPVGINSWGQWNGDGRGLLPWTYWDRHVFEVWTVVDSND